MRSASSGDKKTISLSAFTMVLTSWMDDLNRVRRYRGGSSLFVAGNVKVSGTSQVSGSEVAGFSIVGGASVCIRGTRAARRPGACGSVCSPLARAHENRSSARKLIDAMDAPGDGCDDVDAEGS